MKIEDGRGNLKLQQYKLDQIATSQSQSLKLKTFKKHMMRMRMSSSKSKSLLKIKK